MRNQKYEMTMNARADDQQLTKKLTTDWRGWKIINSIDRS